MKFDFIQSTRKELIIEAKDGTYFIKDCKEENGYYKIKITEDVIEIVFVFWDDEVFLFKVKINKYGELPYNIQSFFAGEQQFEIITEDDFNRHCDFVQNEISKYV